MVNSMRGRTWIVKELEAGSEAYSFDMENHPTLSGVHRRDASIEAKIQVELEIEKYMHSVHGLLADVSYGSPKTVILSKKLIVYEHMCMLLELFRAIINSTQIELVIINEIYDARSAIVKGTFLSEWLIKI